MYFSRFSFFFFFFNFSHDKRKAILMIYILVFEGLEGMNIDDYRIFFTFTFVFFEFSL